MSDMHFNHDEITEYCQRPHNHETLMINSLLMIPESDYFICLGDICLGHDQGIHADIINRIQCKKILVKGNHDKKSCSWYIKHGWDFACDAFKMDYAGKIICFSHKPQPWDGDWELNVHGHLHNLGHRENEYKNLKQWHRLYSPESMGYKPVRLDRFV